MKRIAILLALSLMAGCGGQSGAPVAMPQGVTSNETRGIVSHDVQPLCKGQKTTKQYASLTVTLTQFGGRVCVPTFGGFGGTIQYPTANPATKLLMISSTTNYNHQPNLGNGPALFYLQLSTSHGTTFGARVRAGTGITGKGLKPGNTYTAYGQVVMNSIPINFKPCFEIAAKGKYGGLVGGLWKLGLHVKISSATAILELYSGKHAKYGC